MKSSTLTTNTTFNILLADDDSDDRYFFEMAIKGLPFLSDLIMAENGEKLMTYLHNCTEIPDIIFLDFNMPRKNGAECLTEIKKEDRLKHIPVVIYSTFLDVKSADRLYNSGADLFIQKGNFDDLKKSLELVLLRLSLSKFNRPLRKDFILTSA